MQTNVFQAAPLDQRQQAGHAVNEGFASDEADVGLERGRLDQMLAAAKADLEPGLANRGAKQRRRIVEGLGEIERQLGQQFADQFGLMFAQRLALGAPIETPGRDLALAPRIVDQEK